MSMRYYLCRNDCGIEEVTACYDTIEQADQWAEEQRKTWYAQAGHWYVKRAEQFNEHGTVVKQLEV